MEFEDKVNGIIGKPYDETKFHCYSLVEFLIPKAPKIAGTAESLACSVRHFKDELKYHHLKEINEDELRDKDMVILGHNNIYHHIGVYYDGGIIHNDVNGVVYQPMSMIKKLYTNLQGLRV